MSAPTIATTTVFSTPVETDGVWNFTATTTFTANSFPIGNPVVQNISYGVEADVQPSEVDPGFWQITTKTSINVSADAPVQQVMSYTE